MERVVSNALLPRRPYGDALIFNIIFGEADPPSRSHPTTAHSLQQSPRPD